MKTPQFETPWDTDTSRISGWTRKHWDEAFRLQMAAIMDSASEAGARQRLPGPRSHHGLDADELEGFTRSFIMAGPWLHTSETGRFSWNGEVYDVAAFYRRGLLAGTDPGHPEYWGDIYDYAQHLVECASLAWALYLAKDHLWEPLSESEKKQIAAYLNQCNGVKYHQNNWLLFNLVTNAVLKKLKMPYSQEKIDKNLNAVNHMYMGNGWYRDGDVDRIDYYNAWAFLYYYLIWVYLDGDSKPDVAEEHRQRACDFAVQLPYFIAGDGGMPCFGRSMIYRFAILAPLTLGRAMGIFNGVLTDGLIRSVSGSVMKFYFSEPILTDSEHLSMGFLRPNDAMLEHYSCGGSPYWSSKAFHLLMLPEDETFWQTDEDDLPINRGDFMQPLNPSGLQLAGECSSGHVWMANQKSRHDNPEYNAKYTHFAYSSVFSYESRKIHGSFNCDNVLQWSEDGINWRQRWKMEHLKNEEGFASSRYILHDVDEEGMIWTGQIIRPWGYVTIHNIRCTKPLSFREGGFPLGWDDGDAEIFRDRSIYWAKKGNRVSTVINLVGWDGTEENSGFADEVSGSNVRYRQSRVPSLYRKTGEGRFVLMTAVHTGFEGESAEELRSLVSEVCIEKNVASMKIQGVPVSITIGE